MTGAYWLTGAEVVDGTGMGPRRADVLVEDGRIAAFGQAPASSRALDVTGMTLTPGLIDAHVHLGLSSHVQSSFRRTLSVAERAADMFANAGRMLDAGFTTVRDCGGVDGGLAGVLASGKVRGPRLLQCGPILCQTGGHGHFAAEWEPTAEWDGHGVPGLYQLSLVSDGVDGVRRNAREAFRRGAGFLKMCVTGGVVSTHDKLSDTQFAFEEIAVAVAEASARGTYVTVHAHNNSGITTAVRAGVRCVEHGSFVDERTAALMAEHGVAHVPTLLVAQRIADDPVAMGLSEESAARAAATLAAMKDAVLASRAAGVRVGLGSDLIGPDQDGRASELVLRAALESPMDALVAATSVNAAVLGIADELGSVEVGKRADLVGWRRDPLEDTSVFADTSAVAVVLRDGAVVKDMR
jgi:imidazolonepropionase-like amidohydrolase